MENEENEELPPVVIKDRDGNICFTGYLVYITPEENPNDEEPHICVVDDLGVSVLINMSNDNFDMYVGGIGEDGGTWQSLKTRLQFICYGKTGMDVFSLGVLSGILSSSFILFLLYNVLTNI